MQQNIVVNLFTGTLEDSQLHPEGGPLSFSELHQFLTKTFNEGLLLLCLQDQQQRHNTVHHTLHICRGTERQQDFKSSIQRGASFQMCD